MFRGENQLSATAKISGPKICLGQTDTSIGELYDGSVTYLDVNFFMLSRGLVNPDRTIDPKWPEAVRKNRLNDKTEFGKTRKVYLYGSNSIPAVDAIIAYGSKNSKTGAASASVTATPTPSGSKATSGSGFFIAPSLAVTNHHVVSECSNPVGTTVYGWT